MYDEGGTFKTYPEDFQRRLETAYQSGLGTIEFKDSTGKTQKFVLDTLTDETKKTGMIRKLTISKCVYICLHLFYVTLVNDLIIVFVTFLCYADPRCICGT